MDAPTLDPKDVGTLIRLATAGMTDSRLARVVVCAFCHLGDTPLEQLRAEYGEQFVRHIRQLTE